MYIPGKVFVYVYVCIRILRRVVYTMPIRIVLCLHTNSIYIYDRCLNFVCCMYIVCALHLTGKGVVCIHSDVNIMYGCTC